MPSDTSRTFIPHTRHAKGPRIAEYKSMPSDGELDDHAAITSRFDSVQLCWRVLES